MTGIHLFGAFYFISLLLTGIPLCFIGHWAIPLIYWLLVVLIFIPWTIDNGFQQLFKGLSPLIAGKADEIGQWTFSSIFAGLCWIATTLCFDFSLYFTPGGPATLLVILIGTMIMKDSSISDIVDEFTDDDDIVSVKEV